MSNPASADADADDAPALPANAEDRKAAAALSSLHEPALSDAPPDKQVDSEALGQAIRNLEMSTARSAGGANKAPEEKRRVVKVDPDDVALVMDQLDMSKVRATELLRAHEGGAGAAMAAFVGVPTWR